MARLEALRARIAALEAGTRTPSSAQPFGHPAIDDCLPGGGLPLGRWHELTGSGMEGETAAAPAAFAALLARPLADRGAVVWVMRRDDLYAPGLAGLGFPAERLIQVCAVTQAEALWVIEDALGSAGVAVVVGEVELVDLTAGRRLQLACERHGATGLILHRRFSTRHDSKTPTISGSAAATRWRIDPAPSAPDGEWGIGAARWSVTLERCRGGRPGAWLMEEPKDPTHAPHPFHMVADLADRRLAQTESRRAG
jgi:protein ImuA